MSTAVMTHTDTYAGWLAAGRAIFGGYFVYAGINHFMNLSAMAGFTASKGVPFPEAAVAGTGLLLVLGGASLITGILPRVGAAMIMVFLAGVTPVMHDFWNAPPQQYMAEMGNFMKNVALFGGACFAMALPAPWPFSVRRAD
jgi:putative oxidoreductase